MRACAPLKPANRASPRPRPKPSICSRKVANSNCPACWAMCALAPPTMPPTIQITNIIAIKGSTEPIAEAARGNMRLSIVPAITGNNTIATILRSRFHRSISTYAPANSPVNTGVNAIAARVESIVIVTDKATLPRARYATIFDAVPPGQHATRINPTAKPCSSPMICAIVQPLNGMTMNCRPTPIATARGNWRSRA